MFCDRQNELSQQAVDILARLAETVQQQIDAVHSNDQAALMRLDQQLEKLFGEKERAFGALHQHKREHGC